MEMGDDGGKGRWSDVAEEEDGGEQRFMERSGVCCVLSLFSNFPLCRSRQVRFVWLLLVSVLFLFARAILSRRRPCPYQYYTYGTIR